MGLTAVVYMSRQRVESLFGESVSEHDPRTGEILSLAGRECRVRPQ